jgi:hypothetical protein
MANAQLNAQEVQDLILQVQALTQQRQADVMQRQADHVDVINGVQLLQQAQARIQQLELQAAGAPPPGHNRQPRMPMITFEGKESDDWITFRRAFENIAALHGYHEDFGRRALQTCMRGVAILAVGQINHAAHGETMEDVLNHYEAKFMPPATSAMAKTLFEGAAQQSKEPVLQFHGRLHALWARAYPAWLNQEDMLIRRFAQGLRKQRVREHVLRTNPLTYAAALQAAQAEYAILDAHLGGFGQNGVIPGGAASVEPMEIGAMADIQCHTCKKYGHMARTCSRRSSNSPTTTTRTRSREAGGATGQHPKFRSDNKSKAPPGGRTWKDKDTRQRFRRNLLAEIKVLMEDQDTSEPEEDEEPEGRESDDEPGEQSEHEDQPQDF